VENFVWLSGTGALGNSREAGLAENDVIALAGDVRRLSWELDLLPIAEESTTVLLNMLQEAHELPIERVVLVQTGQADNAVRAQVDSSALVYPPMEKQIPFTYYIDPSDSDRLTVSIVSAEALSDDQQDALYSDLTFWTMATQNGAYRPDGEPVVAFVVASEPKTTERGATMLLEYFSAHAGALDGLMNLGAWFHHSVARLESLTVEEMEEVAIEEGE
jgi:hypothetical protein